VPGGTFEAGNSGPEEAGGANDSAGAGEPAVDEPDADELAAGGLGDGLELG